MTIGGSSVARAFTFDIAVVDDLKRQPIPGATLSFTLNGQDVGEILQSNGIAQLTIYNPVASLGVTARVGSKTQRAEFAPQPLGVRHTFLFDSLTAAQFRKAVGKPTARCATTGQAGQPCVLCQVGNETVKICV